MAESTHQTGTQYWAPAPEIWPPPERGSSSSSRREVGLGGRLLAPPARPGPLGRQGLEVEASRITPPGQEQSRLGSMGHQGHIGACRDWLPRPGRAAHRCRRRGRCGLAPNPWSPNLVAAASHPLRGRPHRYPFGETEDRSRAGLCVRSCRGARR